ncbi:MAG: GNAT family N-acetyltransferase [Gammaproteobacteria bacterium]|nr:GNAT family N-acetyltransferase [Gammaproteobacteria bacterium]
MTRQDFTEFWPTFQGIVQARDSYAIDPAIGFDEAFDYWCALPHKTLVYKQDGRVAGSYYLKPNAAGPGDHICNCGYMVAADFRGRGIAASLCEHSQQLARELGYRAMQFNAVVSTNEAAIHLWQKLGFSVIGRVPEAYRHKQAGYVDALIMYKSLLEQQQANIDDSQTGPDNPGMA